MLKKGGNAECGIHHANDYKSATPIKHPAPPWLLQTVLCLAIPRTHPSGVSPSRSQEARPLGLRELLVSYAAMLRGNAPAGSICPSAGLAMAIRTTADRSTATSVLSQHDATILWVSFTSALNLTLHAQCGTDSHNCNQHHEWCPCTWSPCANPQDLKADHWCPSYSRLYSWQPMWNAYWHPPQNTLDFYCVLRRAI